MNWNEILNTLISTSAVTATVIFVGKRVVEFWFSKDLEKFKADLEKESIKLRIRYESLHTERAKVIKDLYSRIVDTEDKLASLMRPFQMVGEKPQSEKAKEAVRALQELIIYFEQNKIFLDEKSEEKVKKIVDICQETWLDFDFSQILKQYQDKDFVNKWNQAWEKFKKEVPGAKQEIIKEFREIIGIESR